MKITKTDILSFRMQICTECKQNGDNQITDDDFCRGYDDDVRACIDTNMESYS